MTGDKLNPNIISLQILQGFQNSSGSGLDWSNASHSAIKQQLKDLLFSAQDAKCAYCCREIRDEPGHVEIDHILPKQPNGNANKWTSNLRRDRKSTAGYTAFTFVAHNLVLTCKRCNNKKGSYDPRRDRTVAATAAYDLTDLYYEWIHPYVHNYADHIVLLKGMIYQAVASSANGDTVISVCNLDQISVLERKACERKIRGAKAIDKAFLRLMDRFELFGWDHLVQIVHQQFPNEAIEKIREIGEPLRIIAERV
ncbi:HNH endonuclease [Rhizobium leguminosarum]|uniref:HNH endonuclease n=1 Tax=Rhizobium leguminosarum TaxID=384 RepID=UPI003F9EAF48